MTQADEVIPACRCGHWSGDHHRAIGTCQHCICGQYLPICGPWRTDPEDCADCARLEDRPCREHWIMPSSWRWRLG